jgi:very-short-patch-repair endonuclease
VPQEIDFTKCESQFERNVCQAIADKGYRVIPQYHVAGYFIDLVIEGTKSRLAVECDGDEWHGGEQYEKDVARQRILERCGWRFWRISGCEYYRDPSRSLDSLLTTLSEMGIQPLAGVRFDKESLPEQKQCSEAEDYRQDSRSANGNGSENPLTIREIKQDPDGSVDEKSIDIISTNEEEPISAPSTNIKSIEASSGYPNNSETARRPQFDLIDFLTKRQIEFKDNRPKGGAFWLIGGNELAPVISELKAKGILFLYLPRGGRVSGLRPAWYSTTKM